MKKSNSKTDSGFESNQCVPSRACCRLVTGLVLLWGFVAFGKDDAPPSPGKPWSPPGLNHYEQELTRKDAHANRDAAAPELDPEKVYDLPELIDIAERSNPETRIAWERARQVAQVVGLSKSAYYPYLAASAGAGYERAFIPFPTLEQGAGREVSISGGGTLATEATKEVAALNMKWLLFDFGERKATLTAARERLMMANVGFNAVHQQVVFDVTRRFYAFNIARQKVTVAESSLKAAETVAEAARARLENGLTTKPQVLQAEQQTAQASFELEAARGELSDAQVVLVESLGVLPVTKLQVAEVADKPLGDNFDASLDTAIDRALAQRPELVAKLAGVRAGRADVQKAKAAYYPKISLNGNVGYAELDVSVKDSRYFGGNDAIYGAGIAIEMPLFEGFARSKKLHIAESQLRAAESEFERSRDAVVREVWKASTDFKTAQRKQEPATRLLAAAQSAFDASLEAYRQGVGTFVDVANAQRNLTAARSVVVETRSAIFTSATAFALSVGDLAKPSPSTPPIRHQP
jgi:outer membrane protein TolC